MKPGPAKLPPPPNRFTATRDMVYHGQRVLRFATVIEDRITTSLPTHDYLLWLDEEISKLNHSIAQLKLAMLRMERETNGA